jgi:hypothetical protein
MDEEDELHSFRDRFLFPKASTSSCNNLKMMFAWNLTF